MAFPIYVKSVVHWFKREFPDYPIELVHFAKGGSVDQTRLNPYKDRLSVLYLLAEDSLHKVLGFIEYGSEEMIYTIPPYIPQKPVVPVPTIVTMDAIREYVNMPYPTPNPVIDLIILSIGSFDWHYVDTIPLKYLKEANIPLFEICKTVELVDYQTYYRLGKAEPSVWFNVDLSKVPNSLAQHLPLHRGGKLHIGDSDIWQVVVRPAKPAEIIGTQLEYIHKIVMERVNPVKRRRKHVKIIDSREETEALAPPCFRHILGKKRFPVDHERQQLVRTWAKAGVELSVVGEILDSLNEKYPKHMKTQQRWDYVSHYNRGYAPPSCEKMECPLAPGKPIDAKKAECYKQFMEQFPEKKAYTKGFYGPIKWFEW